MLHMELDTNPGQYCTLRLHGGVLVKVHKHTAKTPNIQRFDFKAVLHRHKVYRADIFQTLALGFLH